MCIGTPVSQAGTAIGTFQVNITLNGANESGLCVSSALSQQTNAMVKVTCTGNQFVSIEPQSNKPFVGTHGGAYRYAFTNGTAGIGGAGITADVNVGTGTVTALRVLDLSERDQTIELLVSF